MEFILAAAGTIKTPLYNLISSSYDISIARLPHRSAYFMAALVHTTKKFALSNTVFLRLPSFSLF